MPDNLLSQADIDALVAQNRNNKKQPVVPEKPQATENERKVNTISENQPSLVKEYSLQDIRQAKALKSEQQQLPQKKTDADLTARLSQLEIAFRELKQSETSRVNSMKTIQVMTSQMQELMGKVQILNQQITAFASRLQGTPGADAYHTFECEQCHSKHTVVTVLKCSSCGHQSWRGWWPPK